MRRPKCANCRWSPAPGYDKVHSPKCSMRKSCWSPAPGYEIVHRAKRSNATALRAPKSIKPSIWQLLPPVGSDVSESRPNHQRQLPNLLTGLSGYSDCVSSSLQIIRDSVLKRLRNVQSEAGQEHLQVRAKNTTYCMLDVNSTAPFDMLLAKHFLS